MAALEKGQARHAAWDRAIRAAVAQVRSEDKDVRVLNLGCGAGRSSRQPSCASTWYWHSEGREDSLHLQHIYMSSHTKYIRSYSLPNDLSLQSWRSHAAREIQGCEQVVNIGMSDGCHAGLHAMMALRAGADHVTAVDRWLYMALACKESLVRTVAPLLRQICSEKHKMQTLTSEELLCLWWSRLN